MSRNRDEFDGIDISGPWGGIRIGSGGFGADDWDDDELRQVRRRVRQRLDFLKNAAFFVVITGGLALLDWATGGGWWVQWVAIIWGAFLAMQFLSTFAAPMLWGREAEERMVQREMRRRRGRVHVENPPAGDRAER
jgi:hypothetical protein